MNCGGVWGEKPSRISGRIQENLKGNEKGGVADGEKEGRQREEYKGRGVLTATPL